MSGLPPFAAPMPLDAAAPTALETTRRAPTSAWYALAVLIIATVLGSIDKVILTLLTEPIRQTLSLSDTQLGLLQGAGIVLFTGIATLPLGWLSDRYDRRVVLAACVVLWSAATAMRGTAMDYGVLFVASVGLGVGEAGLTPITNSMIPDLFPRAQRVLANAVFALSAIFGSALGALLGGTIVHLTNDLRPWLPVSMQQLEAWRLTFFVLACAGIPVTFLVLSIRRTPRGGVQEAKPGTPAAPSAGAAATTTLRQHLRLHWRTFAGLVVGVGLTGVGLSSLGTWLPIVTARTYGVTPVQMGQGMGLAFLCGTVAGGLLGVLSMRYVQPRMGPAAALRLIMLGNLSAALMSTLLLFTSSANHNFMLLGLLVVPLIGSAVLLPNVLQDAAPPHLRARTIAMLTMASLPFGVVGPLVVGMLSDALKSVPNGLAVSIVATTLVGGSLGAMVLRATEGPFVRLMREAKPN
ncbi:MULTISPECIES: MFS transporter [unclassified Variovorax]|uniref:MFS transporter n=1 Tax=unclassified Variovorax TaxID=663243 RepID=UPI0008ABAF52|nr:MULTISPECIES: MFS transporter [unclassified Variovorax]SEK10447.1 Sugar phosphate permease [Variovorax sp. OK202]SFD68349.1 Sugar phosphate permease [Variovorax sp. OK212]